MGKFKSSDPSTIVIIFLTVGLLILSVFVKGFTHELLLEAGVFLVSVKLILMARKNAETNNRLEQHLTHIEELLGRKGPGNAG
jgi:hypothetical protein